MTSEQDLENLRTSTPSCAGVAWFGGAPLELRAAAGDPTIAGWSSWAEVAAAAEGLFSDAPVVCGEVLMRLPQAIVLFEQRPGGAVALIMEAAKVSAGLALVKARVTAAQVKVPAPPSSSEEPVEPVEPSAPAATSERRP